eukprot:18792-Heterococcus_DN1.PRE.2
MVKGAASSDAAISSALVITTSETAVGIRQRDSAAPKPHWTALAEIVALTFKRMRLLTSTTLELTQTQTQTNTFTHLTLQATTARLVGMVASLQTLSLCQTVRMGPLGYKQCSELACAQLGASGIDTLAGLALYLRTHGNPFYLLEYCRLAIERELGSTTAIAATAAAAAAAGTAASDTATAGDGCSAESSTAAAIVAAAAANISVAAAVAVDSAATAATAAEAATTADECRDTVLSELGQQKQQQQQQQQQPNRVSDSSGNVNSTSSAQGVWTLSTSKNVFRILQVSLTPSLTAMAAHAACATIACAASLNQTLWTGLCD